MEPRFARRCESEAEVIALHALHVQVGLLAQLPEYGLQDHMGKFQTFPQRADARLPLLTHRAQEKVLHQHGRDIQGGQAMGLRRPEA